MRIDHYCLELHTDYRQRPVSARFKKAVNFLQDVLGTSQVTSVAIVRMMVTRLK